MLKIEFKWKLNSTELMLNGPVLSILYCGVVSRGVHTCTAWKMFRILTQSNRIKSVTPMDDEQAGSECVQRSTNSVSYTALESPASVGRHVKSVWSQSVCYSGNELQLLIQLYRRYRQMVRNDFCA